MFYSKKLNRFNDLKHCFFNKLGGESKGIYRSLNCGLGSLDKKKIVKANIKKACLKLTKRYDELILLKQTHSNKFHFIKENNSKIRIKLKGDALITKNKKIILGILTADCAPIFIYDKKLKIISAIHAGWKGAYKGIIKNVVNYLIDKGSQTKNLIAVIGPCISQKSYEIKHDFKTKFLKQSIKNKIFFKKIKGKTYFSLNKYIYQQLHELNIGKIEIIEKDTFLKKNNFFSARRSFKKNIYDYGRNISLIMIN